MINIDELLKVPYLDGGRDAQGLDCWGLVLAGREAMGLPELLDRDAVTRHTVQAMQQQYKAIAYGLEVGPPVVGALAAVFRAKVFVHVGLVIEIDGRLAVIETNPKTGVRWMFLERFLDVYYKVVFYR